MHNNMKQRLSFHWIEEAEVIVSNAGNADVSCTAVIVAAVNLRFLSYKNTNINCAGIYAVSTKKKY